MSLPEASHLVRGRDAEDAACRYLQRLGYVVLLRNFRVRTGELDIVARDGRTLAIVEVRYRASRSHGGGAASITGTKQARIVAAARALLHRHRALARLPARFDVVEVEGDSPMRCRLIRAAFGA